MSIGVFCNVAESEVDILPVTLKPLMNHPGVHAIVVVHTGNAKPRGFGDLTASSSKIREIHRSFGAGYSLSIAEGGYDQYSARVFALEEIERAGTDWIIQFDADEFLTSTAVDAVLGASPTHDIVAFDYYTPLSHTDYWFEPKIVRQIGYTNLLDPHILIWRSKLQKRPTLCEHTRKTARNITRHCSVSFPDYPYWRTFTAKGHYHYHFHCVLAKENENKRTSHLAFTDPLPPEVVECMLALKERRPI